MDRATGLEDIDAGRDIAPEVVTDREDSIRSRGSSICSSARLLRKKLISFGVNKKPPAGASILDSTDLAPLPLREVARPRLIAPRAAGMESAEGTG